MVVKAHDFDGVVLVSRLFFVMSDALKTNDNKKLTLGSQD